MVYVYMVAIFCACFLVSLGLLQKFGDKSDFVKGLLITVNAGVILAFLYVLARVIFRF